MPLSGIAESPMHGRWGAIMGKFLRQSQWNDQAAALREVSAYPLQLNHLAP